MTTSPAMAVGTRPGLARIGDALLALRVSAMLLVVAIHGSMGYVETRLTNTLWPLYDRSTSPVFDFCFYYGNGIAMPLFFLLSGLFAAQSYASRGPHAFLVQRARRLLVPFLFGLATVVPLTYVVWGFALAVSGQCSMGELLRLKFPAAVRPFLVGPVHLWYLEYLGILLIAFWAVRRLRGSADPRPGWTDRLLQSPWKPLLLAVPSFLILCVDTDTFVRLGNSFVPDVSRLVHYGVFFVVGTWVARLPEPDRWLMPYSRVYLLLSLPAFAALGLLLRQHLQTPLEGPARLALCAAAPLFTWLSVLGYIGFFVRFCNRPLLGGRYLSDASFWVYFAHVPAVVLAQLLLFFVAWPAVLKFFTVTAVGVVVALVTYELGVRHTFIETLLNGPGSRRMLPSRWQVGWRLGLLGGVLATCTVGGLWYFRVALFDNNLHAVIPGQVYRSAQPGGAWLEYYVGRLGLQSVVCLYEDRHLPAEEAAGHARNVDVRLVSLEEERLPSRKELTELVAALDSCRRPVLLHGRWGLGPTGLAAAVAELLSGTEPQRARRQFGPRYGELGVSGVAAVVSGYQGWLSAHGGVHTPDRFRQWVRNDYAP